MAISVGEISATLSLRDQMTAGLQAAARQVQAFAGQTGSAMGNVQQQAGETAKAAQELRHSLSEAFENPLGALKSLGHAFESDLLGSLGQGAMLAGVTATALVGLGTAAFELAEKAAKIGGELNDMAEKTGVSVEALSQLQNAAQVAGTGLGQMTSALFMLQKGLGENSDKVSTGLKRIGLSTEELKAAGPDRYMQVIAEHFKDTTDPAARAAAAMEIFGRQGKELIPALMKLDDALAATADIQPWTTEQAAAAEHLEMQMASIGEHVAAVSTEIGRALIPAVSTAVDWTMTLAVETGKLIGYLTLLTPALSVYHALADNLGQAALAAETAGAKQDVINRAIRLGAPDTIRYGEAVAFVNQQFAGLNPATDRAKESADAWIKKLSETAAAGMKVAAADADLTEGLARMGIVRGEGIEQVNANTEALKKATDEANKHKEEQKKLAGELLKVEHGLTEIPDALSKIGRSYDESKLGKMADELAKVEQNAHIANFGFEGMTDSLKGVGQQVVATQNELNDFAAYDFTGPVQQHIHSLGDTMFEVFSKVPQMVANALSGGGGLADALKGIGSMVGAGLGGDIGRSIGAHFGDIAKGFGHLAGPLGQAIGSLAGPLLEGLLKLFDHVPADLRAVASNYGVQLSDAMLSGVRQSMKELHLSEQAATIFNAAKLFPTVDATNFAQATRLVADAFSMIATHQLSVAQGGQVVTDMWPKLAAAGTDAYGRISDELKHLIQLDAQFGTQSKEIAGFLVQQGDAALTGFTAVVAGMLDINGNLKVYDDLKKRVDDAALSGRDHALALHDQAAAAAAAAGGLTDMGIQAVAAYAAAVAAGKPEAEALKAIHPALQSMQQAYSDLGLDVDDVALKSLMMRDKIVTASPEMVGAIQGLSGEMVALDNMGLMNITTFGAMQRTGQAMFERLQTKVLEMGGTDEDVLSQMQAYLHQAKIEAEKLGIPLDDNTQKLIDQSEKAGIWQEAVTPQDKLLKGMQSLIDKVGELVDRMNGIPQKADSAAAATHEAAGRMVKDWDDVKYAVDGVATGHSPDGIKQITIEVNKAMSALATAGHFSQTTFGSMSGDILAVIKQLQLAQEAALAMGDAVGAASIGAKIKGVSQGKDAADAIGPQQIHDLAVAALTSHGFEASEANLQALASAAGYIQGTSVSRHWAETFLLSEAAFNAVKGSLKRGGSFYLAGGAEDIRGTDSIPAMLSPGESVLTRDATNALGADSVRALNHGTWTDGSDEILAELRLLRDMPFHIRNAVRDGMLRAAPARR